MRLLRPIAGVVCAVLGVWLLVSVFHAPAESAAPVAFTSSRDCRACHAEVYAEWERSQHAMAWTNPAVRALSNDFANQDCIDCHAPRPVFVSGIGERVLPRATRRVEGVDCIACHQLPDEKDAAGNLVPGGMAGTITNERAACRPVQTLELARVEFCSGCHDQHQTVQQWKDSEWPARGEDCLSCHMPFRDGDASSGRSHVCLGGNDLALLKRAVLLRAVRAGEGWVVEVENVGAGHSFPTDERSRAADVFWRPRASNGSAPVAWRHLHRFRSPYRHEVDVPDTLLAAHETRRIPIEAAEGVGAVEVALFYKRSPYFADPEHPDPEREAILVHSLVLEP